ncbi:MAG: protein kinase family protein [Parachlamydiales bacterium]|nr:protein kinase family protein [Parachlamydiales bacterium]
MAAISSHRSKSLDNFDRDCLATYQEKRQKIIEDMDGYPHSWQEEVMEQCDRIDGYIDSPFLRRATQLDKLEKLSAKIKQVRKKIIKALVTHYSRQEYLSFIKSIQRIWKLPEGEKYIRLSKGSLCQCVFRNTSASLVCIGDFLNQGTYKSVYKAIQITYNLDQEITHFSLSDPLVWASTVQLVDTNRGLIDITYREYQLLTEFSAENSRLFPSPLFTWFHKARHTHMLEAVFPRFKGDMRSWMKQEKPDLNNPFFEKYSFLLEVFSNIGEALRFLHERQYLHGDIKPDNFLLSRPSQRKHRVPLATLWDYGFTDKVQNLSKYILYTSRYRPPERRKPTEGSYTTALFCDIWAFGMSMLDLCYYGRFCVESIKKLRRRQCVERFFNTHAPLPREKEIRTLMLEMLHQKPSERPTIAQVLERISSMQQALREEAY